MNGHELVAVSLARLGVKHAFSVSGTPLVETLASCASVGVRPIGVRNEQGAVLMAAAHGYVAGGPTAVPLLASGPGVTNGITGLLLARDNRWPLVVLGGRSALSAPIGAFQELDAVPVVESLTRWAAVVNEVNAIPEHLGRAFRLAMQGAPAPVYLDLPGDVLDESATVEPPGPSLSELQPGVADARIGRAADVLARARRPLLIVGRDLRWSEPWPQLRQLVERYRIPFITSPMARGALPEDHPLCCNAARSRAQSEADVVVLAGDRLDWLLRFGRGFGADAAIVQLTADKDDHHLNRRAEVALAGNLRTLLETILAALPGRCATSGDWPASLAREASRQRERLAAQLTDESLPISPHRLVGELTEMLPRDAIVIVDGNQIMAAARQGLPAFAPASRLNCGASACVGVGVPFAIGAALARPNVPVLALCGDCAFGFSAMELETAARHNVPIVVVVANNDGISGRRTHQRFYPPDYPERVTMYQADLRYDRLAETLGAHGEYVERPDELRPALERALSAGRPACVNVRVNPDADLVTRR